MGESSKSWQRIALLSVVTAAGVFAAVYLGDPLYHELLEGLGFSHSTHKNKRPLHR